MPVLLPRSPVDPNGTSVLERKASDEFKAKLKLIRAGAMAIFEQIPRSSFYLNAGGISSPRTYRYAIDETRLEIMNSELAALVDSVLLKGGRMGLWFFETYVRPSYTRGTAVSYSNISVQSAEYLASRGEFASLVSSAPFRRRIGLIRARMFEEMQGFASDVSRKTLSRVLTEGMVAGQNPLKIADQITKGLGTDYGRAKRIARTEINQALRTARMDETEDAKVSLGLNFKLLHFSALSPTTRDDHAERHGLMYTIQEERDFFASGANSINCKCSTVEILLKKDGTPYDKNILGKMALAREKFFKIRMELAQEKKKGL